MAYKVLVDDLTVNSDGGEITDLFGNVIGHQTLSNIYSKGTVLDDDQVGEALRESVDRGETEGYLEKVGDGEGSDYVAEPFPGYGDLSVEEVQAIFKVVPSETIRAIVEFEASDDGEGRSGIVDYHIGRGEAFTDRLEGRASSPAQEGEEKPALESIVTREVGESDFVFGESLSDDGQPQVDFGHKEGDDTPEGEKATSADGKTKTGSRRGRRAAAKAAPAKDATPAAAEASGDKD
jgi:hypothetical protein